jgi:hypothetical protein
MQLGAVVVLNSNITVNINGINVKIGDNIALLGYINIGFNSFLNNDDITKRFALFMPEYEDSHISITFNADTGIITEIDYFSPS